MSADQVAPHLTIFGALKYAPKYAKYGQICIFGAYLGAPNMVKWGVPEKILQNADRQNGVLSEYIMTKCKGRNMI